MKKRLSILIITVVILLVASEVAFPWLVGAFLAKGLAKNAGTDDITAKVIKRPAVAMFNGRFDNVLVRALNAKIDKLTFSELDIALENAKVDMGALLGQKTLVLQSVGVIDLTAVMTQEELARYLNQSVKGVKNATVAVEGGKVKITGNYSIGPVAALAVTLEGRVAGDGQKLKFVTERFLINKSAVGNIGGSFLSEITLADLRKLPFGVNIKSVNMDEGRVTILADNR